MSTEPLVSVVTPVYNGEPFLAECIESVLKQTYKNFEYLIINNCSKDRTLEIAERYAKLDGRIRIHSPAEFVGVIENHNRAFRLISPASKYCKVVSADDWIFPECFQRMVDLAEAHPSAGIIGSYQLSGGDARWYLRTHGLPYHKSLVPGREICRAHLMGKLDVLGNPTSSLYRADLVRGTDRFFPNPTAEADISACYLHLKNSDFGFVHQVLSYERIHEIRQTTTSADLNRYLSSRLGDLLAYGPFYLSADEVRTCIDSLLAKYYKYLASSVLNFRSRDFWDYHKQRLAELGYPLDRFRLGQAVAAKLLDLLLNPKCTLESLLNRARAHHPDPSVAQACRLEKQHA